MRRFSAIVAAATVLALLPVAALADQGGGNQERNQAHMQERHQLQLEHDAAAAPACEGSMEQERERERHQARIQEQECRADGSCNDGETRTFPHHWMWQHEAGDQCRVEAMWQFQQEWRNLLAGLF